MKSALIIFIKNPILGKVKTRLAATIGDEKALLIFHYLLNHTFQITKDLEVDKYLFYSDFIEINDFWPNEIYQKRLQNQSSDLGERMFSAFKELVDRGYQKIVIIGSDIFENTSKIIQSSFDFLSSTQTVIGKAVDGGYYAIGFNFEKIDSETFLQKIFLNKTWSHELVATVALSVIDSFSFTCNFLPTLTDIDTEKDLKLFSSLYNNL